MRKVISRRAVLEKGISSFLFYGNMRSRYPILSFRGEEGLHVYNVCMQSAAQAEDDAVL